MQLFLMFCSTVILIYLGWGVFYQVIFSIAGRFWDDIVLPPLGIHRKIAVLIPAYKEDKVILQVAKEAIAHDYPTEKFEVVVIADSLQAATLLELQKLPLRLVFVDFDQSTKSKAINAALNQIPSREFDVVVILDADNTMAPGFLHHINGHFELGHRVVQGCRSAKNENTPMAILDGLSEAVNNHILCKGHIVLGLSARLAGSGMAFDETLFRSVMPKIDAIGGFDKALELRLTASGERIMYAPQAIILDEKVSKPEHFSQQRSRWIAAQFYYAKRFFPDALKALFVHGMIDYFNKATQMLLPPRLITPGVLFLFTVFWFLNGNANMGFSFAIVLFFNIISFLLALPSYTWRQPYINALFQLPMIFLYALKSIGSTGKANRQFIHTPHGESE